jgi:hypothetical protein
MIEIEERPFLREEWVRMTDGLGGLSLMQTWEFGEVRSAQDSWSSVRAVAMSGRSPVAVFQAAVRKLPIVGGGLVWINRGPLIIDNAHPMEDVLAGIGRWAARKRMYARIAPPVESLDESRLAAAGFRMTGSSGWCSSSVDLAMASEDRRSRLDQKWRNCLNKAVRTGLTVTHASTDAAMDAYAEVLRQRLEERPFATTVTPEFLRALQARLPDDRKLSVFTATLDDRQLGFHVTARYGGTAEYVSGLMTDEGRRVNAGHALLWHAMETMASLGLRRYDLGGMHPDLTPRGIFHFKEGAGGSFYRLANEVETTGRDWRSVLIRRRVEAARQVGTGSE